jgi:nitrogen regulatory protein P-II 1
LDGLKTENLKRNCNITLKEPINRKQEDKYMKEIKAIIRPFKLTDVLTELHGIEGLPGIAVSEIKRFGQSGAKEIDTGLIDFVAEIKIEIVVPDHLVEKTVSVIQATAHTGNTGDGKIFILPVEDVVIIRTNERGSEVH